MMGCCCNARTGCCCNAIVNGGSRALRCDRKTGSGPFVNSCNGRETSSQFQPVIPMGIFMLSSVPFSQLSASVGFSTSALSVSWAKLAVSVTAGLCEDP